MIYPWIIFMIYIYLSYDKKIVVANLGKRFFQGPETEALPTSELQDQCVEPLIIIHIYLNCFFQRSNSYIANQCVWQTVSPFGYIAQWICVCFCIVSAIVLMYTLDDSTCGNCAKLSKSMSDTLRCPLNPATLLFLLPFWLGPKGRQTLRRFFSSKLGSQVDALSPWLGHLSILQIGVGIGTSTSFKFTVWKAFYIALYYILLKWYCIFLLIVLHCIFNLYIKNNICNNDIDIDMFRILHGTWRHVLVTTYFGFSMEHGGSLPDEKPRNHVHNAFIG